MAENERTTEITDSVRLPDGTTVKEYTNEETGNITYRRTGKGISGAQFISPDVAEGLKQTTELGGPIRIPEGELTQAELREYGIGLTAEELRKNRLQNKYPQWDSYDGLSTQTIPGGESKKTERWIQGWMENNEVQQQVRNDPLLNNSNDRARAREALAREIVSNLQDVRSRNEAMQVLREYGIY